MSSRPDLARGSNRPTRLAVPTNPWEHLTHYLFRFPAKFHPPVVAALLERYSEPGQTVLDPFCGSGTLLVESLRLGRHSLGIDVDPVAVAVSRAKVHRHDIRRLRNSANDVNARLRFHRRTRDEYEALKFVDIDKDKYAVQANSLEAYIPKIPNLHHWFRRYVIIDLARLRLEIDRAAIPRTHRHFLEIVFASIIRNASNADPVPVSGLEVTKWMREKDEAGRIVDPFDLFDKALHKALLAAAELASATQATTRATVRQGDITDLTRPVSGEIDLVLTSPPYHGAVDYYRRHQLEMFWLGLTETQQDRLALLDRYIGRPHVPQRHEWVRKELTLPLAAEWERQMRAHSDGRANEFRHYVNSMSLALNRISATLSDGARCLLVVGHSGWNGDEIPTTDLFVEMAAPSLKLDEVLEYPVKNRYMSYARHNGASIGSERALVMTRATRTP